MRLEQRDAAQRKLKRRGTLIYGKEGKRNEKSESKKEGKKRKGKKKVYFTTRTKKKINPAVK